MRKNFKWNFHKKINYYRSRIHRRHLYNSGMDWDDAALNANNYWGKLNAQYYYRKKNKNRYRKKFKRFIKRKFI